MMPSREDYIKDNIGYYVKGIRLYVYRLIALGVKPNVIGNYLTKLSKELFAGDLPSSLRISSNMDPTAARSHTNDTKKGGD